MCEYRHGPSGGIPRAGLLFYCDNCQLDILPYRVIIGVVAVTDSFDNIIFDICTAVVF